MRKFALLLHLLRALVLQSYIIPGLSVITGSLLITGNQLGRDQAFTAANLGNNPTKCVVEHVDASGHSHTYEFHPAHEHPRIKYPVWTYQGTCSFLLTNIQAEDAGNWTIKYFEPSKNNATGISEELKGISVTQLKISDLLKTGKFTRKTADIYLVETFAGDVTNFETVLTYGNISKCIAIHNDTIYYEIYPNLNFTSALHKDKNYCGFEIVKTELFYEGKWTIMTYLEQTSRQNYSKKPETMTFLLHVKETTTPDAPTPEETTTQEVTTQLTTTTPIPVERIDSQIGNYIWFPASPKKGKVIRCTATNNGNVYEIYPRMNLTNGEHKDSRTCTFSITSARWENSGTWIITSYLNITSANGAEVIAKNDIYELTIEEHVQTLPAGSVTMNNGYATFYIPKTFENPTSCLLTNDKGANYELINNDVDESEGIELFDTCGVRMRVDQSRAGKWKLQQSRGDYEQVVSYFQIQWHLDEEPPATHYLFWRRGEKGTIELYQHSSVYCDVVRPDGVIIPLTEGSCKYTVEEVSDVHAGVWKARYGVPYSMNLLEEDIIVEVWNPEAVEISISTSDDRINLMCRTALAWLNGCTYQMPNGTILSLRPSMGDDKYEYYGSGFSESSNYDIPKKAECGLIIRNPSSSDYGLWKCAMRQGKIVRNAIIDVLEPRGRKKSEMEAFSSEVFVKRGDKFTVKCQTDTPLTYCWLRSPNGTMYSVTKKGNGENFLRYNGEGLSMGVCGAIVENAEDTDNGDWSCRLGVAGGAEIESIVPVTVTEFGLISLTKNLSINRGSSASLSCRTFPSTESTIDYCRWLRPNGNGIDRDSLMNYAQSSDNTTCTLTINEVTSADYGTWTCYAGLSSGSDEEVHSRIELTPRIQFTSTNVTLNALAITLAVTAVAGACFLGIMFYRRKKLRNSQPASPPPYYDFNIPKNMEIKVNQNVKC